MKQRIIVWFRKDFRLYDNPALYSAALRGKVLPVYIYDEKYEGSWRTGSASKWWLHSALYDIKERLAELNIPFIIQKGNSLTILRKIIRDTNADALYLNVRHEPHAYQQDQEIMKQLRQEDIVCHTFESHLLLPSHTVKKANGEPYKVFTPYYKAFLNQMVPKPFPIPELISFSYKDTLQIEDLQLLPKVNWIDDIAKNWEPTERAAYVKLRTFASHKIVDYEMGRDFPSHALHSAISPYLAFGQLSPRAVYHYIASKQEGHAFIRQLIWREFAYHLLHHFPHTVTEPLNGNFQYFPWRDDEDSFEAWSKGRTGYPLVDAGMRELWATGFMHNRVRMVVSSFLVKHLLIPWQKGAAWFWDTLVDADLANNTMGWQWVAGSGADAAPYFRIFNPVTQGEKFDDTGEYVRKWVPELGSLPNKYIHKPWIAPKNVLDEANVILGITYPYPIVDHAAARARALHAYEAMKKSLS
ncbi:deoxyribodipyrimidine photo-lyase [Ectobacillus antri]|uniref:Deoxyribodipyrimidine photo-lyase n=1 Tax=Ectobacillus antri TaxID=2486280 RepID=A0ABT6H4D6_9BACI|nr:deoxyribodipyrimidine photo-lyase [Ectobacillus antri]MDG4656727.1 deoxyribodipyrimidine photo-lyase [Ectobacillus antri]MDG5753910.1 deoxyribodipyrimidine photo-lyase [Ectobacillus antri]